MRSGFLSASVGFVLAVTTLDAFGTERPALEDAAVEFDAGVEFFDAAEYSAAARAFLRADQRVPNGEAVANAITAALETTDYLLVVEAARRGIERSGDDAALAAEAREALAEARAHLAELDLSCAPEPCRLTLDGVNVDPGAHFVLPGIHAVVAHGVGSRANAERRQSCEVGTRYRLRLDVRSDTAASPRVVRRAPARRIAGRTAAAPPAGADGEGDSPGLDPAWFYVGAALSAVLLGVTIWSGVDAVSANSDAGATASRSEIDAIEGKILRTDLLLTGTAVATAGTAVVGLALVDWNDAERDAGSDTAQGAILTWRGTF